MCCNSHEMMAAFKECASANGVNGGVRYFIQLKALAQPCLAWGRKGIRARSSWLIWQRTSHSKLAEARFKSAQGPGEFMGATAKIIHCKTEFFEAKHV
jgi:hypothetical protein